MILKHSAYFKAVTDNDGNLKQAMKEILIGEMTTHDVPDETDISEVNTELTCGFGERLSQLVSIIVYEMKNYKKFELENLLTDVYNELKKHDGEVATGLAERTAKLMNAMGILNEKQSMINTTVNVE